MSRRGEKGVRKSRGEKEKRKGRDEERRRGGKEDIERRIGGVEEDNLTSKPMCLSICTLERG